MKNTLILIFILIFQLFYSQIFEISGKIQNASKKAVEDATVSLYSVKDSTIINYTNSEKEGTFSLKIDKKSQYFILKINADSYEEYSQSFSGLEKDAKLGVIELKKDNTQDIAGVVIQAAPPIKIKEDTIEFNAQSFKVKMDAKVEDLIRALPGFEITNDGKIMSNGKEVKEIVVNGKPFFDKDGQIILKNLPADLIKKVQVSTLRTEEEKIKKEKPKSEDLSLNFTIDEKKNKGFMGRVYAGLGSDQRYEGSLLASYFKGQAKLSVLGSSNNINVSGFKNDEVYNSTGQGRNAVSASSTQKGISRSTTLGFNYSDQFSKGADLDNLSYSYTDKDRETHSITDRTTLLNDYSLRTKSESSSKNENSQHSVNNAFRFKVDDTTNLYFANNFSNNLTSGNSFSTSETWRDNELLNENNSQNKTTSRGTQLGSTLNFSKMLNKKGRRISLFLSGNSSESINDNYTLSETTFAQDASKNDKRNQWYHNQILSSNFGNSVEFTEPVSDSAKVSLNLNYRNTYEKSLRDVSDFNEVTGDYTEANTQLSNRFLEKNNVFTPRLQYSLNKKHLNLWAEFDLGFTNMKVDALYVGENYLWSRNYALPNGSVNMRYNKGNSSLSFSARSSYSLPSALQLTPYEDASNPLVTYRGNPDLENPWQGNVSVFYRNFNRLKNRSFFVNLGFNYQNNNIASNRFYHPETGAQEVSYTNISGNKSGNLYVRYSKRYKWGNHQFSIDPRVGFNYSYQKGLVNGSAYLGQTYTFSPGINLTYEIKERLTIKPSYSLSFNQTDYTNYTLDQSNTATQVFSLQSISYFLADKNLVFENDFSYNTNSRIAPGFKKDFYFWNTSIGYSFMKKQMTAKVMVYDVLNQNQSVSRIITDTYIEDRQDLILKRYIMFTLSYKLNKFGSGGKPPREEGRRMRFN